MSHIKRTTKKGFTLIELLVAVGLFTIVMSISLGVIMSIIDGNKKSQAVSSVSNNLNFAIESMVRDIKTGYDYRCDPTAFAIPSLLKGSSPTCNSGAALTSLSLISTIASADTNEERSVKYEFIAPTPTSEGYISKSICDTSTCHVGSRITSPEINITEMKFYVKNDASHQGNPNAIQPGVFLLIKGTAKINPTTVSDFSLQTYISQRLLKI